MRMKRLLLLSFFFVLLVPSSFVLAVDNTPCGKNGDHVPGEIIIGFKSDITQERIKATVSSMGGQVIGKINLPKVKIRKVKISSTTKSTMGATIKGLRTNPSFTNEILYAEPNIIRRAFGNVRSLGNSGILSQSSDPLISGQWGYYDIGANWLPAPPYTAPIIAEIDTGVDYTHPDLKRRVIKGYDFINADADPMDDNGHGTHVAGIAAAKVNNAYGIAGISWNSKILAIKALNSQGWGTDFDISRGIIYAADYPGVKVINMSFGGEFSSTEQAVIEYAIEKGKLLVTAAGNDNTSDPTNAYPAALSTTYPGRVLAVAAHNTDHCKADFSNYGTWVSITAPGVDILSTVPYSIGGYGFDFYEGTSMAAAHISGAAAAAWAYYPTYKNTDIAALITTKTDSVVRDGTCWPNGSNDGTFQRLDLVNMLVPSFYNECDNRAIWGFALDAENGEPFAGAKIKTSYAGIVTGTDFVPYYGAMSDPLGDTILGEGYGLFSLFLNYPSTPQSPQDLKIIKNGYTRPTLPVPIAQCDNYAGNIPVPPNKAKYWLAVTWDPGYTGAFYDSALYISFYSSDTEPYNIYYDNLGTLNAAPWAKYLWDSDDEFDQAVGNLRAFSEVIRIKKTVPGDYFFYVWDNVNGAGSTSWASSGIKAYIYKWDPVTLTQNLVKTYTPPAGDAGRYWDICIINRNTITDINDLTDY